MVLARVAEFSGPVEGSSVHWVLWEKTEPAELLGDTTATWKTCLLMQDQDTSSPQPGASMNFLSVHQDSSKVHQLRMIGMGERRAPTTHPLTTSPPQVLPQADNTQRDPELLRRVHSWVLSIL